MADLRELTLRLASARSDQLSPLPLIYLEEPSFDTVAVSEPSSSELSGQIGLRSGGTNNLAHLGVY